MTPSPIRPPALASCPARSSDDLLRDCLQELQNAQGDSRDNVKNALNDLETFLKAHPHLVMSSARALSAESDFHPHLIALAEIVSSSTDLPFCQMVLRNASLDLVQELSRPETRLQALAVLGNLGQIDEQSFSLVSDLSQSDADLQIRYGAIATMALWLNGPVQWREKITETLSEIARQSPERKLQGDALRILIAHHTRLPDFVRELINQFLENQPNAADRLMIGLTIGAFAEDEETRSFALTHLEEAFRLETDVEQRRYILSQIVRFGQGGLVERLAQLPVSHDLLAQDIRDYQEILAQGACDPMEVERLKVERDHRRGSPLLTDEEERVR